MKNRRRNRRLAKTKLHRSASKVDLEIEFAFSRLSARYYVWVVADIENDIKEAGLTPRMPPDGATAVAKAKAFFANDTIEQALADRELIETCGIRYLRRRMQERKAARKSAHRRFNRIRARKRRRVRSRVRVRNHRPR